MELKIESTYGILSIRKEQNVATLTIDEKDFIEYLYEGKADDEVDLEYQLETYLNDYHFDSCFPVNRDEMFDDDCDSELVIMNITELLSQLSYLIREPEVEELKDCCKEAPSTANYCSVCGNFLH